MTLPEWRAIVAALQAAGHDEVAILAAWQLARTGGAKRSDATESVRAAMSRALAISEHVSPTKPEPAPVRQNATKRAGMTAEGFYDARVIACRAAQAELPLDAPAPAAHDYAEETADMREAA